MMKSFEFKRKMSAMLCVALLMTSCAPAALAEATPSEAQETAAPQAAFERATVNIVNASTDAAADGSIEGAALFTGEKQLVAKLYAQTDQDTAIAEYVIAESGDSYVFTNLAAGVYVIKFFFWGEGDQPPKGKVTAEVGYNAPAVENAFYNASVYAERESADGAKDGKIYGAAEFSGTKKLFAKLFSAADPGNQLAHYGMSASGESYAFTGLAAGDYIVRFYFDGEGDQPALYEQLVTVSVNVSAGTAHYAPILASVSSTNDSITLNVTQATDGERLLATLNGGAPVEIAKGTPYTFTGLAAGSYTVRVNYEALGVGHSEYAFTQTVTLGASSNPTNPYLPILASVSSTNDSITINVTQATDGEKLLATLNGGAPVEIAKGTPYTFTGLTNGTYDISVNYAATGTGQEPFYQTVMLENSAAVPAKPIAASASITGQTTIEVQISEADALPITVTLLQDGDILGTRDVTGSGTKATFANLADGTYVVSISYSYDPNNPALAGAGTVEITNLVINTKPAPIQISAVQPGENQLIVVGSAQPNAEIIVTTNPSSTATVVKSKADGMFVATIVAPANTYTHVYAKYSTDASSLVTASGKWTVAAPAVKPALTVDPVDVNSTTVIGKTSAGVTVKLTAKDYTQTATADAKGLVYFTLPHTYLKGDTFTFTVYYGAGNVQSFTQKITVGSAASYQTLQYGWEGDAVRRLTARLAELGYPVSQTSRYGSTVREAVRLFQRANGLDDDGIAGQKTQAALYSVSAIAYGSDTYPTLVRGDRGYALIYTLQQRLKELGYYTLKVDGIYGSGTQRAVRDFQRVNGLNQTGKADNATQTLLYSSSAKPADGSVSGDYDTLKRSSRYQSKVIPLQRRLKALGYYAGSIDGYFGSQTYRAVRNFQSRNGLSVTGVADPYTQQVLHSSSARPASGSSSSSSSTGYRLLYWGCTGSAVKTLQNALINAGYKSIVRTADGIFGQWTYDAVRAYQKDHGLAVDGIAGKNTQNSLYGTNY